MTPLDSTTTTEDKASTTAEASPRVSDTTKTKTQSQSDDGDGSPLLPPKPTVSQLLACQFSSWYPIFRDLHRCGVPSLSSSSPDQPPTPPSGYKNVTIRSIIIKPLPPNFLEYLKGNDGITLPIGATKLSSFLPDDKDDDGGWSSSEEDDDDDDDHHHNSAPSKPPPPPKQQYHFPNLNQQITNAIDKLGGSVLPKLNWSSPKDVTWLNAGSMECKTVGDVYLMLKSSDFCTHDLVHALDGIDLSNEGEKNEREEKNREEMGEKGMEVEYELVLRKWSNLHASMEFRCFVGNRRLVAVSQRNHTQHYPHLLNDHTIILTSITTFFETTIRPNYGTTAPNTTATTDTDQQPPTTTTIPSHYVFDAYVDKNNRVWLIDFNIWGERTDPLLFQWEELVHLADTDEKPVMRIVRDENEVRYDPLASYRGPVDAVDLAQGEGDREGLKSFEEFQKMCEQRKAE